MPLKILQINETCTGCGACVSSCKTGALTLMYDSEGFYYPKLDNSKCINCKQCEKNCHVLNSPAAKANRKYTPYMVKALSKEILQSSSSGGVFSLLANLCLSKEGIVYGAAYNFSNERLEYGSTNKIKLQALKKSKYIESYAGKICKEVGEDLKKGKLILFTGTPCQISALKHYLSCHKINQSNLLLIRFLCHGVPSNKLFTQYKHWEEARNKSTIIHFDFRPKSRGWRQTDMQIKFKNGNIVTEPGNCNLYYKAYYDPENLLLRKCCYNCTQIFRDTADLTIADFWGIKKYQPDNKDNEGISLVLTHSDKGEEALTSISKDAIIEQLPQQAIDYIYKDNEHKQSLYNKREEVMTKIANIGYLNYALKKYSMKIKKEKIKNTTIVPAKKIIKRIKEII